ncbi:hypothetical protein [Pantoea sp. BAV 3049]|uniref:hypothetical protein n=1 Tax=Pantoea sp. BAV 3049 TaxID=2654188 RepID=UPI00131D3473|nr:hypothetical protein [Pantoea sp. BAV 3049]
MTKYFFKGMYGLGDSIYQRPFLSYFPGAYVRTCWPELYQDLDINCVRSKTRLRTQAKNELRTSYTFHSPPSSKDLIVKSIGYSAKDLTMGGIIQTFRNQFGVSGNLLFDLPHFNDDHPWIPTDKKIAVIRPATIRTEWASNSRNPDPEYLAIAARTLRQHFYVVSVADTLHGVEWIVGSEPEADLKLHRGELSLTQLCSLYDRASCIVSPVGFSLPMAIAYKKPLFIIAGGRGGHNAPNIVTDATMNLSKLSWAIPDKYCMCTNANHNCSKYISSFDNKLNEWLYEIVL